MKRFVPPLLLLALASACGTPETVRHLAAEAALIQPGITTLAEAHQYLGEPQSISEVAPGVTRLSYAEDTPGLWGRVPLVGGMAGPSGYETLVLIVKDGVVQSAAFRNFNEKDRAWVDDDHKE